MVIMLTTTVDISTATEPRTVVKGARGWRGRGRFARPIIIERDHYYRRTGQRSRAPCPGVVYPPAVTLRCSAREVEEGGRGGALLLLADAELLGDRQRGVVGSHIRSRPSTRSHHRLRSLLLGTAGSHRTSVPRAPRPGLY